MNHRQALLRNAGLSCNFTFIFMDTCIKMETRDKKLNGGNYEQCQGYSQYEGW
jgi:hypothetical protein